MHINKLDEKLLKACRTGEIEIVESLLDRGADIEAKDELRQTALIIASNWGYAEIVKLLLDRGADIEAEDELRQTALIRACWSGATETIKLLLDRGANTEARNNEGWTALMTASYGEHAEIVKLLLDREAKSRDGLTAGDLTDSSEIKESLTIVGAVKMKHDYSEYYTPEEYDMNSDMYDYLYHKELEFVHSMEDNLQDSIECLLSAVSEFGLRSADEAKVYSIICDIVELKNRISGKVRRFL